MILQFLFLNMERKIYMALLGSLLKKAASSPTVRNMAMKAAQNPKVRDAALKAAKAVAENMMKNKKNK